MALINRRKTIKSTASASLGKHQDISDQFKLHESVLFNAETASSMNKVTAGNESDEAVTGLDQSFTTVQSTLRTIFKDANFSEAGIESAARTAILLGNPAEFYANVKDSEILAGNESFSRESLGKFREAIVEINALSAEATGLLQALYPVIEVGAAYGGLELSLQRFCKIGNVINSGGGAEVSWERQHIVEAYRTAGILNSNFNVLYPIVITGTNESYFPADLQLCGTTEIPNMLGFRTSPLKPTDQTINLLGLARVPTPSGQMDKHTFNDRINEGARLGSIFISLGADASREAFELPLDMYNTVQFLRGSNTNKRNTTRAELNAKDLTIDLTTVKAKAVPELKALSDLAYVKLTFRQTINATLDLHDGNFNQTFSTTTISGVYKANDELNYVTESTLSGALGAVKPKYEAFTIKASLSSKTLRLRGDRVDEETIPYTFTMTAQSPITAERAISETEVNDIIAVMGATEAIRRETQAVEHIVDSVNELYARFGNDTATHVDPHGTNMVGLCYVPRPWVKIEEIDIKDLVDSTSSRNRREDIASALVHLLADRAIDGITKINYLESLRTYTKDSTAKADFLLFSARNIGRYLYTEGDDRTFGAIADEVEEKPTVVTTSLDIMDDTIIMIPKGKPSNETLNVFGWGNCLRGTTLMYDVEMTEGDSTKRHLQLQPFYEFTVNMPFAYMLKVNGLSKFLASKAAILIDNSGIMPIADVKEVK